MPTTAQRFYLGTVDDDQTGGSVVKKLQETAPAANSTTTDTWTTTTAEVRTVIPLAGSTTASDTSSANGWAFNQGGTDGLGSATGAERWIKPGVWSFSVSFTLNTPALLATIACTVTARVYRVASGGGARTLLFTAASANFSATGVITWSSAAQPEVVLAPGEVVQVGFTAVSAATANALGTVTNTVLTTNLGSSSFFDVPAPGVRTLARTDVRASGTGALAGSGTRVLGAVYTAAGLGVLSGAVGARAAGTYALAGTGTATLLGSSVAGAVYSLAGSGSLAGRVSIILSGVYQANSGSSGGGSQPVTPAEIDAIAAKAATAVWDELTATTRASGSYGALVRTNVDAQTSSRSTPAQVTAAAAPLARTDDSRFGNLDAPVSRSATPAQLTAATDPLAKQATLTTRASQDSVTALGSPAQASTVGTPLQTGDTRIGALAKTSDVQSRASQSSVDGLLAQFSVELGTQLQPLAHTTDLTVLTTALTDLRVAVAGTALQSSVNDLAAQIAALAEQGSDLTPVVTVLVALRQVVARLVQDPSLVEVGEPGLSGLLPAPLVAAVAPPTLGGT